MYDLNKIRTYVDKTFSNFGVNKKKEITRLLFEINKREPIPFLKIIKNLKNRQFSLIKEQLLKKRFPYSYSGEKEKFYLPGLKINPEYKVKIKRFNLYPKNVYVEEKVKNSYLISRLKNFFPKANFKIIGSLKNYLKRKSFTLNDYNQRKDNFFIVKEQYDFFKKCPCSKNAVSCSYNIFNLGFGCIYECVYCFLQEYTNSPGIIIPANLEDFFKRFSLSPKTNFIFKVIRIGNGEFTDSLALDEITEFSTQLIHFFKDYPKVFFEFKTKSKNIKNIINSKPQKNIIVSWSLNPPKIIEENEFYTAGLDERIASALSCIKAGFKVGFHFDPILYYDNWLKDYLRVVDYLFDVIKVESIAWISLGTLRFSPSLKKIIENRFPKNKILDEEFILGFDKKMRYPLNLRIMMYKKMIKGIRKRNKKSLFYLCMEEKNVWKRVYEGRYSYN